MRWPVASLVGLLVLLSAADAAARPPSHPPGAMGLRPWSAPAPARSAAPARVGATCDEVPGAQCGRVFVPLNRDRPNGPQIGIFFAVFPHTDDTAPAERPIFATFGGPGASATQIGGEGFASGLFGPLRERRDIVLIDYRGTGLSQAINCEPLQQGNPDQIYELRRLCGEQLGRASDLYGSEDVAKDIEAVRKALSVRRFDFFGFSYAGADAQAYAVRYPRRVGRVVLDAPVPLVGYDPWFTDVAGEVTTTVRGTCRRSASCARDHDDPVGELAWLIRRLQRAPVDGTAFDSLGDPYTVHVGEPALVDLLAHERGGFTSESEIAAAARALHGGDPAPLLRLAAETHTTFPPDPPEIFSAGLNSARFCSDYPSQWDKLAPFPKRLRQFERARDALDPRRFAPFSIDGWVAPAPLAVGLPNPCIGWPAPTHRRERGVPRGANAGGIPALVLVGEYDLQVPPATARHARKVFPNSRQIEVAASGHTTVFDGNGECAATLLQRFLGTGSVGDASCAAQPAFAWPGVGRFPLTSADARPATPASAEDRSTPADRRLATAAAATVTDAFRRAFIAGPTDHGKPLRGGFANTTFDDTGVTADLALAHFVEDLGVTGQARYDFETSAIDANVALVVPGSFGQVQVSGVWFGPGASVLRVDGQIGGRRVVVEVPAT